MKAKPVTKIENIFKEAAISIVAAISSFWAFLFSFMLILSWLIYGLWFGFSDSLQILLHDSLSIVTFFIVLLIQHTEYREYRSIQLKLDELLKGVEGASNTFIDIEKQPDKTLDVLENKVIGHKKTAAKPAHATQHQKAGS